MGNIKEINIKNRTYYFFNDRINSKDFDSNLLKKDKMSYKNIHISCIGYITMKDSYYVKIKSVNPLYLIISEVHAYMKENGNKYLSFNSADKNKEVLKKYAKLWNGIKNEIETINGSKEGEYGKDFMKIKFDTDDNLPLNKTLKFHKMTIVLDLLLKKMVNFILKFI